MVVSPTKNVYPPGTTPTRTLDGIPAAAGPIRSGSVPLPPTPHAGPSADTSPQGSDSSVGNVPEPMPPGPVNAHVAPPREIRGSPLPIVLSIAAILVTVTLAIMILALRDGDGSSSSAPNTPPPSPSTGPGGPTAPTNSQPFFQLQTKTPKPGSPAKSVLPGKTGSNSAPADKAAVAALAHPPPGNPQDDHGQPPSDNTPVETTARNPAESLTPATGPGPYDDPVAAKGPPDTSATTRGAGDSPTLPSPSALTQLGTALSNAAQPLGNASSIVPIGNWSKQQRWRRFPNTRRWSAG